MSGAPAGTPAAGGARSLAADRRGMAMVEFAIVLPFLLLLYLGGVYLSNALSCQRKLTAASRFVADHVSQLVVAEPTDLDDVFRTAQVIMAPYAASGIGIRITALQTDRDGVTRVVWSRAVRQAALRRNADVALPTTLVEPGRSLIRVETSYRFRLVKAAGLPPAVDLTDELYMSPRSSAAVQCKNCL